jgi:hypothetical protein
MARRKPRKTAKTATVRLVGYARVSTEDQAREGVSLEAQRERLAAYATAHGLELVGIETDAGISGKVPPAQRPRPIRFERLTLMPPALPGERSPTSRIALDGQP